MGKEHGEDRHAHEHQSGDYRTSGETRDAAYAVTAGAAGTQAGTETHQKPRHHDNWQGRLHHYGYCAARRQHVDEGAEQEARDEDHTPASTPPLWCQQTADDAADPTDTPV